MVLEEVIFENAYISSCQGYLFFKSGVLDIKRLKIENAVPYHGVLRGVDGQRYEKFQDVIKRFNFEVGKFRDEKIEGDYIIEAIDNRNIYSVFVLSMRKRNAKYFVGGELIWEKNDEKQPIIVENGKLWSNSSIVANMVDRRGTELICFDPYNRTKLWKYHIQEKPQRKIQSILRYENTLILGLSDFRGVSNWMMVALDRRTGEQIWEMDSKLAVYKHNTIVYKDSLLNLASDRLIEIDIATGTVKRDIHLDFLKNVDFEERERRIRLLKGWKVLDDKIFFISERELVIGIVDLHTLDLLDYAFVPSTEQSPIISLTDLEVHNEQVFVVGLNPEVKSVTFIYTY